MKKFPWIAYSLAIGIWNALFTGIVISVLNIIHACTKHPLSNTADIVLTYIIGYIVLFVLNVKIVDNND